MQTTRLLVFIPVWKRPEITEICFMGIERLRNSGLFPIEALAVISEDSMIELCEKYSILWTMHVNQPLGEKKNHGLREALNLDWDYLIELGSDDLLKTEYLERFKNHIGQDVFGIDHFTFLNSEDGSCRNYKTKNNFGLGRAISRKVVNKIGNLWKPVATKSMDNYSMFLMASKGFLMKRMFSDTPLGIDIKSETNIWPFNYLMGKEASLEDTLTGLSEKEVSAIKNLICVTV